jgi:hypothetical protein
MLSCPSASGSGLCAITRRGLASQVGALAQDWACVAGKYDRLTVPCCVFAGRGGLVAVLE